MNQKRTYLCVVPKFRGSGGPSAFLGNLRAGLKERGIEFEDDIKTTRAGTILVLGGTRHLIDLWQAKSRGICIVQRLDGMNWLHRKKWTGIKHFLRSEWLNWNLAFIRRALADSIIYQSKFTETWWNQVYGEVNKQSEVIINGVNTGVFKPEKQHQKLEGRINISVVEGSFLGGHERDLMNAIDFAGTLSKRTKIPVEILIAGKIPPETQFNIDTPEGVVIVWLGEISKSEVIACNQKAHLFFSAEINAPCPNSVLEALACGLPVVSYRTGSLPELVRSGAGELVEYGADYWKLAKPDAESLAKASMQVLHQLEKYRECARSSAEQNFNVNKMLDHYYQILLH